MGTQMLIKVLMAVYDSAEGLRDCATQEEKEAWNHVRRTLPGTWSALQNMDNRMSESQAKSEVGKPHKLFISIERD